MQRFGDIYKNLKIEERSASDLQELKSSPPIFSDENINVLQQFTDQVQQVDSGLEKLKQGFYLIDSNQIQNHTRMELADELYRNLMELKQSLLELEKVGNDLVKLEIIDDDLINQLRTCQRILNELEKDDPYISHNEKLALLVVPLIDYFWNFKNELENYTHAVLKEKIPAQAKINKLTAQLANLRNTEKISTPNVSPELFTLKDMVKEILSHLSAEELINYRRISKTFKKSVDVLFLSLIQNAALTQEERKRFFELDLSLQNIIINRLLKGENKKIKELMALLCTPHEKNKMIELCLDRAKLEKFRIHNTLKQHADIVTFFLTLGLISASQLTEENIFYAISSKDILIAFEEKLIHSNHLSTLGKMIFYNDIESLAPKLLDALRKKIIFFSDEILPNPNCVATANAIPKNINYRKAYALVEILINNGIILLEENYFTLKDLFKFYNTQTFNITIINPNVLKALRRKWITPADLKQMEDYKINLIFTVGGEKALVALQHRCLTQVLDKYFRKSPRHVEDFISYLNESLNENVYQKDSRYSEAALLLQKRWRGNIARKQFTLFKELNNFVKTNDSNTLFCSIHKMSSIKQKIENKLFKEATNDLEELNRQSFR